MKYLSTVLSSLALLGVIILFVMESREPAPTKARIAVNDSTKEVTPGAIAYFEMDSIEQHYSYIKDVRDQLKKQEQSIAADLENTKKGYMNRIQQLQAKAPNMSQQEGEAAQAEINQMQLNMQQKEAKLAQGLQEKQFKMMQDINNKIAEFLKVYNSDRRFSYIISHQPGDFLYYSDTVYNITADVLKGLNDLARKK